jgi:hypothetical protein
MALAWLAAKETAPASVTRSVTEPATTETAPAAAPEKPAVPAVPEVPK